MNKKQIIGLIAAALVFVFVGASSIMVNSFANNQKPKETNVKKIEKILGDASVSIPYNDYIGVVEVKGTIQDVETTSAFGNTTGYNHKKTLKYIDDMMDSDCNKGILLVVNTPGGGVYESDELYLKLEEYKKKTKRPIWTYMESQACSGGYYISMATDKIYANRNCWTGSIGVIISTYNYKELLDKLGVKEINITSGVNKSMGSPGEKMSDEQRAILQGMVDESYDQFVEIVSKGRKLDEKTVRKIADGRIYTAKQALELGLIDEVESYENTIKKIKKEVGTKVEIFTPEKDEFSFASIFAKAKELKPKSETEILSEVMDKMGNEVPMYYAEPKQ